MDKIENIPKNEYELQLLLLEPLGKQRQYFVTNLEE
jgi:hypothetical protein